MNNLDLGKKLKNIRDVLRINQKELAKILEIDQGRLSKIESGDLNFTSEMASNIALKLNVNPNYLLGYESNMFLKNKSREAVLQVDEPKLLYKQNHSDAYYIKMEENFKLKEEIIQLKTEIIRLKQILLDNNLKP
jgi:transcriptional regulator with XRE-family HTH domain